jgi:hypothetical protein
MDVVDWSALSVLAAVMLGAVGYLSRQINRVEERLSGRMDRMEDRFSSRFDRLEEQYIRHLELHAR